MSKTTFFSFAGTRRRMYAGPLGPYVDEFIAWLQQQQYTQHSIRCKIRVVADFSRWLSRRHLGADTLDAERVSLFLACRERLSSCTLGDFSALRQLADLLLRKQILKQWSVVLPPNERDQLEEAFCTHLLQDQGLRPTTPECYIRHIFLLHTSCDERC